MPSADAPDSPATRPATSARLQRVLLCVGFLLVGLGFGTGWAHQWTRYPALVGAVIESVGLASLLGGVLGLLRHGRAG